jgi:hypothetical protein
MRPQTLSGEGPQMTRRAALALGVLGGAGVVGGCALNNPLSDEKTPAARAVRDLSPDVAVAVEAATLVRGAQAAVRSTGEQHPQLSSRLTGLTTMHQTHLDAVVRAVPDRVDTSASGAPYVVPAREAAAVTGLEAAERTLHDGLIGLALRAESGPFARLLGSMAAAVSQQVHGLAA